MQFLNKYLLDYDETVPELLLPRHVLTLIWNNVFYQNLKVRNLHYRKSAMCVDGWVWGYWEHMVIFFIKYSIEHTQPNRNRTETFWNILLDLRPLRIVWSLVRRRVTRRLTRLKTMHNVLKYRKMWTGEITTKFQFTGTGVQPHRKRKLIQFYYAQYCICYHYMYICQEHIALEIQ